ncbi:MAG: guanylate kinase [Thermoanaerobaculia bacterium]
MSSDGEPGQENAATAGGRGEIIVLSAPSGAGKTTLIKRFFERYPRIAAAMRFAVSHTTRAPRRGEVDGKDYHFVSRPIFEDMITAGGFLEWAVVHGRHYGTSLEAVEPELDCGHDVILDIDVQGARRVRRHRPRVASVFIMPPSFAVLERRLRGRALDAPEQIARRLRTAIEEMREHEGYDYVIVNDDLGRASEALAAVFLARRFRRPRMRRQIGRILEQFPNL